MTLSV